MIVGRCSAESWNVILSSVQIKVMEVSTPAQETLAMKKTSFHTCFGKDFNSLIVEANLAVEFYTLWSFEAYHFFFF